MAEKKTTYYLLYLFMGFCCVVSFCTEIFAAEELYIITARDGSVRIVQDYRFTDQHVEFTTREGVFGFIDRTDFVKIENMIGVPPSQATPSTELEEKIEHLLDNWFFPGIAAAVIVIILIIVRRGRKKGNRQELTVTTSGHLAFTYKEGFGRKSEWTIEVRSAYIEKGILYFEGFCIKTDKLKKFQADRVMGPVTDKSNGHQAPVEKFFHSG